MSKYAKLARRDTHTASATREGQRAGTYMGWQADHVGKAVSATALTRDTRERWVIMPESGRVTDALRDNSATLMPGNGIEAGTARRWDNGCHKARKARQGNVSDTRSAI
ncbi:MAG: hypothetical protein MUP13_11740 [Thermoanaerobaculales bacterium]|nr:hypothetical protein [Thermoanaerobaculales bacterium]